MKKLILEINKADGENNYNYWSISSSDIDLLTIDELKNKYGRYFTNLYISNSHHQDDWYYCLDNNRENVLTSLTNIELDTYYQKNKYDEYVNYFNIAYNNFQRKLNNFKNYEFQIEIEFQKTLDDQIKIINSNVDDILSDENIIYYFGSEVFRLFMLNKPQIELMEPDSILPNDHFQNQINTNIPNLILNLKNLWSKVIIYKSKYCNIKVK
ncbi:MAG: hypothetical protein PHD05_00670 [Sphaerochaetaceae bacterium]|nr:hypothetical protein [Sphaerochaetaceae bacterium]